MKASKSRILFMEGFGYFAYPWGSTHTGFGPFATEWAAKREIREQRKAKGKTCPIHQEARR